MRILSQVGWKVMGISMNIKKEPGRNWMVV